MKATKFGEITENTRLLRHSRSFKVTDLVINTNLPPILHRFQVMADYIQIFASKRESLHFNDHAVGDSLRISP